MAAFRRLRALRRRLTPRLAWDLLMVYLAFLNLGLILFDLTYLWLRPHYLKWAPAVTRLYDDVKGIEPHPMTERFLELIDRLDELVPEEDGSSPSEADRREIDRLIAELRTLSVQLFEDNPFERSGQTRSLIRYGVGIRETLRREDAEPGDPRAAAEEFWCDDLPRLRTHLDHFERSLRPLLAANYHRTYGLDGKLTDHFWLIDLPFLLLFAAEFAVRWIVAVRRGSHARWFFFPILNWYDLLGIVPVRGMRIFRLFRIASIYIRLNRSELTGVGDDFISRAGRYISNIVAEEISDLVAIRILDETAEEIRGGRHRQIVRDVLTPHRARLAAELTERLRGALASTAFQDPARSFLDANLERALESSEALRRLPLPERLTRPLVNAVGRAVFDSIVDTLVATLESEEGRRALSSILEEAVDGFIDEMAEGELEPILREISLDVIAQVRAAVAVRKWALPDESTAGGGRADGAPSGDSDRGISSGA